MNDIVIIALLFAVLVAALLAYSTWEDVSDRRKARHRDRRRAQARRRRPPAPEHRTAVADQPEPSATPVAVLPTEFIVQRQHDELVSAADAIAERDHYIDQLLEANQRYARIHDEIQAANQQLVTYSESLLAALHATEPSRSELDTHLAELVEATAR